MEVERAELGNPASAAQQTPHSDGRSGAALRLETNAGIPGVVPRTCCHPLAGVLSHGGDTEVMP